MVEDNADRSFSLSHYPIITSSYSLRFFQIAALNEFCCDRQFSCRQVQGALRYFFRNSVDLEKNAARPYYGSPELQVTLTLTHTYFRRFAGNGLVGEDADPHISFTFHM